MMEVFNSGKKEREGGAVYQCPNLLALFQQVIVPKKIFTQICMFFGNFVIIIINITKVTIKIII